MAVKNEWVLKAHDQFQVDVVNISAYDLRYVSSALGKAEFASRVTTEPVLDRMVSANIQSEAARFAQLHPFVIREFPSRQPGSKPVRVAFIGLTETTPAPPPGLKFVDPAEAAKRIVPEAKKQADLVVVLSKVTSQREIARIVGEAPGIDIIINGNSQGLEDSFTAPVYVGKTLVVFTPYETRILGELRFYRGAQGKFTTRQRFIALDETLVPEDPAAKVLVDTATKAESDSRANSKTLLENWLATSRMFRGSKSPGPDSSVGGASIAYVTSSACSQCHMAQYMKWSNSAHAHATDPLPPRAVEFDASCLECHATGSRRANGTNKPEVAIMQNVQCEQCHGPGADHVAKPSKGYGRVASMQSACTACHTPEVSPAFEVQAAWERIKH